MSRNPPAWLDELWYAMDVARNCYKHESWELQDAYDTMGRYINRHPTGKYVEECKQLRDKIEPYLPNEFGDDDGNA